MNFARAVAATGRSHGDMETTALRVLDRGGRVDFDVQHVDRTPRTVHAAQLSVTGTALEFVPQGSCESGTVLVPLSALTSVQTDHGVLSLEFRTKGELHHLRLQNPAHKATPAAENADTDTLGSLRNIIARITAKPSAK